MSTAEKAQNAREVSDRAEEMAIIHRQVQDLIQMGLRQLESGEEDFLDTTLRAAKRYLQDADQINHTLIFYTGD